MAKNGIGRPSKRSIAMKAMWARKRALAAEQLHRAGKLKFSPEGGDLGDGKPITKKKMYVRILSHQDGVCWDVMELPVDAWGQFLDTIHNNYMGIHISEILITIK